MGFWPVPLSLFSVAINGNLTQSFHAEWGLPLCLYYLCGGICQISTSSVFSGLDSVFQTVSWGKPHRTNPFGQLPSSGNGSGNLSPGIHLSLNRVWIILATMCDGAVWNLTHLVEGQLEWNRYLLSLYLDTILQIPHREEWIWLYEVLESWNR